MILNYLLNKWRVCDDDDADPSIKDIFAVLCHIRTIVSCIFFLILVGFGSLFSDGSETFFQRTVGLLTLALLFSLPSVITAVSLLDYYANNYLKKRKSNQHPRANQAFGGDDGWSAGATLPVDASSCGDGVPVGKTNNTDDSSEQKCG